MSHNIENLSNPSFREVDISKHQKVPILPQIIQSCKIRRGWSQSVSIYKNVIIFKPYLLLPRFYENSLNMDYG